MDLVCAGTGEGSASKGMDGISLAEGSGEETNNSSSISTSESPVTETNSSRSISAIASSSFDRSKHEPRVGVSIPSGILLEKPPAARTLHHRGENGVVIALLGRKRRNCGEGERFFRHGVRVY